MAIAITSIIAREPSRIGRRVIFDFTGPASYTTGGELFTAAQQDVLFPELGPGQTLDMTKATFFTAEETATGKSTILDKANNKLLFFTAAHAQETSTQDLSGITYRAKIDYAIRTS